MHTMHNVNWTYNKLWQRRQHFTYLINVKLSQFKNLPDLRSCRQQLINCMALCNKTTLLIGTFPTGLRLVTVQHMLTILKMSRTVRRFLSSYKSLSFRITLNCSYGLNSILLRNLAPVKSVNLYHLFLMPHLDLESYHHVKMGLMRHE